VSYHRSRVSFPPPCVSPLLAVAVLINSIMGCFLRRSPISVDLLTQPPPASASGETETSTPDLPCNKRARKEDAGSDLGRAKENRCSPRLEFVEGEVRAEEPVRPEAPANVVSSPATAAEAVPTRAGETTSAETATPPPAIEEIAAGDVTAANTSSDPPSQEDTREVATKMMEDTPVRAGSLEPSEPAARTPSSPELAPSARAAVPVFGTEAGMADGPLFFGLASNSGEVAQGPFTTRVVGSERGEAFPAPEAATKDTSRGKAPAAAAGSGIGSLSSTGQL
jgi:hypothetical protein